MENGLNCNRLLFNSLSRIHTHSYKEDSEDRTDSDDLIEQDEATTQQQIIEEDVEIIEKVVRHRQGWPGRMYKEF